MNLRQLLLGIVISSGLTLPTISHAQHTYFWRDAQGNANYSDRCPPAVTCQVKRLRAGAGTSVASPQPSSARQGSSRSGVPIPSSVAGAHARAYTGTSAYAGAHTGARASANARASAHASASACTRANARAGACACATACRHHCAHDADRPCRFRDHPYIGDALLGRCQR